MGASPCLPATSATVRLSQARLSRASHSSNMVKGGSGTLMGGFPEQPCAPEAAGGGKWCRREESNLRPRPSYHYRFHGHPGGVFVVWTIP